MAPFYGGDVPSSLDNLGPVSPCHLSLFPSVQAVWRPEGPWAGWARHTQDCCVSSTEGSVPEGKTGSKWGGAGMSPEC